PRQHHKHLKSTNMLERLNEEIRRRTYVVPHAFIAQRRLEQSADMLRSTNLSATEIAMECGFGSSSHFTTAFKRAFGVGPTEFRRKCRI
ncbi:helix-turn-helix domain-containing protein, partial [Mesorhizobium sp. M1252]|uniref:helix-turn-helix transcriptional regulator n=1 Tax=Mesorhizobium sp. M1252 TaxID=2957073 RepID=UPI003338184C